jgi:hypothetical protein
MYFWQSLNEFSFQYFDVYDHSPSDDPNVSKQLIHDQTLEQRLPLVDEFFRLGKESCAKFHDEEKSMICLKFSSHLEEMIKIYEEKSD